jgi:branched-chain amino acid aminotransferase
MYYNEKTILYYNGSYLKADQPFLDLYGQTLHYGYGVFEGIRAYPVDGGTKIFKAKEHYERLKQSANSINIPFDTGPDELTEVTYEVLKRNGFTDAYVRPLIFCSPNMSLTRPNSVSLMICAWEWGAYLGEKRLDVMISSYCRPHPRSIKIEAKVCGHYVNSILAASEAKDNGYDESILLDCEGNLGEGPGSNLFFEKDGIIYTPQTGHILPGITRATVIELCAELGITCKEEVYKLDDLLRADSAFLCGTAAEIIGINSVNRKPLPREWSTTLGALLQKAYKHKVLEKQFNRENVGT